MKYKLMAKIFSTKSEAKKLLNTYMLKFEALKKEGLKSIASKVTDDVCAKAKTAACQAKDFAIKQTDVIVEKIGKDKVDAAVEKFTIKAKEVQQTTYFKKGMQM